MRLRVERDPGEHRGTAIGCGVRGHRRDQRDARPERGRVSRVAPLAGGEERDPAGRPCEDMQRSGGVAVRAGLLHGRQRRCRERGERLPHALERQDPRHRIGRCGGVLDVDRPREGGRRAEASLTVVPGSGSGSSRRRARQRPDRAERPAARWRPRRSPRIVTAPAWPVCATVVHESRLWHGGGRHDRARRGRGRPRTALPDRGHGHGDGRVDVARRQVV